VFLILFWTYNKFDVIKTISTYLVINISDPIRSSQLDPSDYFLFIVFSVWIYLINQHVVWDWVITNYRKSKFISNEYTRGKNFSSNYIFFFLNLNFHIKKKTKNKKEKKEKDRIMLSSYLNLLFLYCANFVSDFIFFTYFLLILIVM